MIFLDQENPYAHPMLLATEVPEINPCTLFPCFCPIPRQNFSSLFLFAMYYLATIYRLSSPLLSSSSKSEIGIGRHGMGGKEGTLPPQRNELLAACDSFSGAPGN